MSYNCIFNLITEKSLSIKAITENSGMASECVRKTSLIFDLTNYKNKYVVIDNYI